MSTELLNIHCMCIIYNSDFFSTQIFFPGEVENSLNEFNVHVITCTGLFSPPGRNKQLSIQKLNTRNRITCTQLK